MFYNFFMLKRRLLWALIGICAFAAFASFAYPMYVIRPFRGQGSRELFLALTVRSWAPILSSVAVVLAMITAVLLWRETKRILARITLASVALLTVGFAFLSHVNVYELMFHRIDAPETLPASAVKLAGDDMLLAININGHARAYPIRMMGYHHIVNDWLGDVPVVATY